MLCSFTVAAKNITSTSLITNPPDEATDDVLITNSSFLESNKIDVSTTKEIEASASIPEPEEEQPAPERSSDFEDTANSLFRFLRNLLYFGPLADPLLSEDSFTPPKHADLLLDNIKTKGREANNAVVDATKKAIDATVHNEKVEEISKSIGIRDVSDGASSAEETDNPHDSRKDCEKHHHVHVLFLMHVPNHGHRDVATSDPWPSKKSFDSPIMQWFRKVEASAKQKTVKDKESISFNEISTNQSDTTITNNEDAIYVPSDEDGNIDNEFLKRKKKVASVDEIVSDMTLTPTINETRVLNTEEANDVNIWNIHELPNKTGALEDTSAKHFLLNSGDTDESITAKISETLQPLSNRVKRNIAGFANVNELNSTLHIEDKERVRDNSSTAAYYANHTATEDVPYNNNTDLQDTDNGVEDNSASHPKYNIIGFQDTVEKVELNSASDINVKERVRNIKSVSAFYENNTSRTDVSYNNTDVTTSTQAGSLPQTSTNQRNVANTLQTTRIRYSVDFEEIGPNLYLQIEDQNSIDGSEIKRSSKSHGPVTKSYFLLVTLPTVFSKIFMY